jgi:hypothetical protein
MSFQQRGKPHTGAIAEDNLRAAQQIGEPRLFSSQVEGMDIHIQHEGTPLAPYETENRFVQLPHSEGIHWYTEQLTPFRRAYEIR